MEELEKRFYIFDEVELEIEDFDSDGFILDIGGGGEGVIGRLKGKEVIAIDIRREELEEVAEGPLKIVLDARQLKFLEESFNTVTAFFSMMYIEDEQDQHKIMGEIFRVLKPGGHFHLWDIDLSHRPNTDKSRYLVHLKYRIRGEVRETGYGFRWPSASRGVGYYITMGEGVGLRHIETKRNDLLFYLLFCKEC